MQLEVWSDLACPWCYIGSRRLEEALAVYEHAAEVEVTWRSYELDPAAADDAGESIHALLARKVGGTVEDARGMVDRVVGVAREAGLSYDPEAQRPGNTFLAHQLVKLAELQGSGAAMMERLFRAHFAEGALLSDVDTLERLAVEVGLDGERVREALAAGAFERAVRDDELVASQLGISGVPCFVIDRRSAVSGAQPAELLVRALEIARATAGTDGGR